MATTTRTAPRIEKKKRVKKPALVARIDKTQAQLKQLEALKKGVVKSVRVVKKEI